MEQSKNKSTDDDEWGRYLGWQDRILEEAIERFGPKYEKKVPDLVDPAASPSTRPRTL